MEEQFYIFLNTNLTSPASSQETDIDFCELVEKEGKKNIIVHMLIVEGYSCTNQKLEDINSSISIIDLSLALMKSAERSSKDHQS